MNAPRITLPLVLLLLAAAMSAEAGPDIREVSRSSACSSVPANLQPSCKAHRGSSLPFRYLLIESSAGCETLRDTVDRAACRANLAAGDAHGLQVSEGQADPPDSEVAVLSLEERTALAAERTARASERTALVSTIQLVLFTIAAAASLVSAIVLLSE